MKVIMGITLILLSTLLLIGFNAHISASDTNLTGEMSIGALLSMTGDLAPFGGNSKVAIDLAVEEVNEFLRKAGANWNLSLVVEDTQTDPDIALEKVKSLAARGIELLVGPLSSAEVRAIKGYCDANRILVISQSSTAADLAIADDYIFRFCPTDKLGQGPAIARIMYDDGKRYVIPVTRNDAWGKGLEDATKDRFNDPDLGGTFLPGILYDPEATEFLTEAADLATRVSDAIATYGADEVAVLHISFEEVNALMTACLAYPELDDVKWYGSDGTMASGAMLVDPDVRDFAMNVSYPGPIFSPTHSDKWEKVRQNGIAELGGEPDSYAYNAYDIVWVYALSLLEVDAYDGEAVKVVLPTVTRNYFGASGWIELDENGDRKSGEYDIWQITETDGTYDWKVVGKYIFATDSIVWSPRTPAPIYVFEPIWNSKIFYVVTESNSTVSDYYFDPVEGPFIKFNVTGSDGTTGFCRVAIPKQLLWVENGWVVLVGDEPVVPTVTEDDYYTYLYFTYTHSTKTVQIIGTHVMLAHPIAMFTYSPESPLVGEAVTFDASASYNPYGDIISFEWDFGDGTTGKGLTVNRTYTEPETYIVTLTVRDAAGNENTHSITITIRHAEDIREPRPLYIVAEVAVAGAAVTATTAALASFGGLGQSFNSAVSRLPIPDQLKEFLQLYGEKIFETVDKAKLEALEKAPFITKGEIAALGISALIMTIVLGFVEANGLPRFLEPSVLAAVIPSTLLSACMVSIAAELSEVLCARTCRVYRQFRLWMYGFGAFLISGLVFLFPFASPGITRYQSGDISNKTKGLIVLSKMLILLTLTIPFASLFMLGFKIIGDAGLLLTLMTVCYSLVPLKPIAGKAVFDYRKEVSLIALVSVGILFYSCTVNLLPHVTYLPVGVVSAFLAAITLSQLRKQRARRITRT